LCNPPGTSAPSENSTSAAWIAAKELRDRARPIIGIIDDGIAFAHRRFRRRGLVGGQPGWVPRIVWFWDQGQTGSRPCRGSEVGYGAEWAVAPASGTAADNLTELLTRCTHAGLVDEDKVYRIANQTQVKQRARHGTHVLDLAAGAEPDDQGAPPIVAVQLPEQVAANPGDPVVQWHILEGLAYIVWRAYCMPRPPDTRPPPIIVNLSYGVFDGPHDGSLLLERAMDRLVTACEPLGPLVIVLAAGNHAQALCRAKFDPIAPGAGAELRWNIPPDNDRPAAAEFWMDSGGDVEFEMVSPGGKRRWTLTDGSASDDPVSLIHEAARAGGRSKAQIRVMPTNRQGASGVTATCGVWTLRITNKSNAAAHVDAWIRRSDTPFGMKGHARQSHFLDTAYKMFEPNGRLKEMDPVPSQATVVRSGTLSGFATGKHPIVVGAACGSAHDGIRPTAYTAQGFLNGRKPDLMALGDRSLGRPGILAAGTRSGSVVSLNGTSAAVPAAVRAIATAMSCGKCETIAEALACVTNTLDKPSAALTGGGRMLKVSVTRAEGWR
jgi:hypothetical protein